MRTFTKEEIKELHDHFQSQRYPQVHDVEVDGQVFSYFVVPQSEKPELPGFVRSYTGESIDEELYDIADSVEDEYMRYAVAHEVYKHRVIRNFDKPGWCLEALEWELEHVPVDIRCGYIHMRKEFFEHLVILAATHPEDYKQEDVQEFRKSLDRLKELAPGVLFPE